MKKYINLEDMANVNCSNVLNIIQKNGSVSRKEITELSGLSWAGMTKIVNKLLENGYIVEEKLEKSQTSGRIPGVLSVNTGKNFVIGLDINKTGLSAIVEDLTGKILSNYSAPASAADSKAFLKEIKQFVSNILNKFEKGNIISIGIAMQGIVDSKKGVSVKFPDISDWENVNLKDILEKEFGINVFVEHDPDCLLYPHITPGTNENIVLLRIDKSVGMAVSVCGKIIKSKGIFEIAHTTVIPNGKLCNCGNHGCLEAYISPCAEELILPLAITVKNMSGLFYADKIILTGALMEHFRQHEKAFKEKLMSLGCNTVVEFFDTSDFAVRGAAMFAVNSSINSLLI